MKPATALIVAFVLLLVLDTTARAQTRPTIRVYGNVGYLLTPPNTADLDYSVDGVAGGLDDVQEVDQMTYGFGVELLKETKPGMSIGGGVGLKRLFSSKVTGDVTSTSNYSNDYDKEWGVFLNGLLEFSSANSPAFFQVGAGPRLVFWEWESEFSSVYSTEYDSDSGNNVNWGAMGAVGTKLQMGPSLAIPVMIRADIMNRYGMFATIGVLTGLEF